MTQTPGSTHLAGFELTNGDIATIVLLIAILALSALVYLSIFVGVLVRCAQRLHQSGRTRHPYLLVVVPTLAFLVGYGTLPTVASGWLFAIGVVLGYGVIFWDGRSWFRWTAAPVVVSMLIVAAGAR